MTASPFIYENHNVTHLVESLSQHMTRYGFMPTQVPAIADVNIFLKKAGDQVIERLFTFERFGNQLALRPEFTALAAHRYATSYPDGDYVARWQFNGSVFTDTTNQADYQQMSVGAELIGANGLLTDAEMILMATQGLREVLGLQDIKIAIGHASLLKNALAQFGLDQFTEHFLLEQASRHEDIAENIDDILSLYDQHISQFQKPITQQQGSTEGGTQQMLDVMLDATRIGETMGGRTRQDIVNRMARKVNRTLQRNNVAEALAFLADLSKVTTLDDLRQLTSDDAIRPFSKLINALYQSGIPQDTLTISPMLVRNWNYYTGVVFQFQHTSGAVFGGGGRYNELVQLLGSNRPIPSIGFAYYIEDILPYYTPSTSQSKSLTLHLDGTQSEPSTTLLWAAALRHLGANIVITEASEANQANSLLLGKDGTINYQDASYQQSDAEQLLNAIKDSSSD